jgi:hypothetical protein
VTGMAGLTIDSSSANLVNVKMKSGLRRVISEVCSVRSVSKSSLDNLRKHRSAILQRLSSSLFLRNAQLAVLRPTSAAAYASSGQAGKDVVKTVGCKVSTRKLSEFTFYLCCVPWRDANHACHKETGELPSLTTRSMYVGPQCNFDLSDQSAHIWPAPSTCEAEHPSLLPTSIHHASGEQTRPWSH